MQINVRYENCQLVTSLLLEAKFRLPNYRKTDLQYTQANNELLPKCYPVKLLPSIKRYVINFPIYVQI